MLVDIRLKAGRFWPPAEPTDRHDFVAFRMIQNDRRHTRDLHQVRLHDAERNPGRDPCVERVSTRFEHLVSRFRGQVVPGGDHIVIGFDCRLQRHLHFLPRTLGASPGRVLS